MCRVCMKEIGRAVPVYAELTEREKQAVDAVARGKSNKVIAHDLGVTVGTIKTYLATIFRKLHFQDRTSLALWRQREQLTRGIDRIAEGIDLPPADNPDGLKTKWAAIKDGTGKVVGYIELFWGGKLGWVSVPGASRVIASGSEVPS